jgi:hypothetical protein
MGTAQSTGSEEAHERAGDGGRDLDAKLQQGLPAETRVTGSARTGGRWRGRGSPQRGRTEAVATA